MQELPPFRMRGRRALFPCTQVWPSVAVLDFAYPQNYVVRVLMRMQAVLQTANKASYKKGWKTS